MRWIHRHIFASDNNEITAIFTASRLRKFASGLRIRTRHSDQRLEPELDAETSDPDCGGACAERDRESRRTSAIGVAAATVKY